MTSALPYANGPIHLGHLVEYIQTDIWVRYHKLLENEIYYFCADDTHGTPIMLTAKKMNLSPEDLIEKIHKEHLRDFSLFEIEFNNYYTTNSEENKKFSEFVYFKAKEKGYIYKKKVKQLFCPEDKMFLPDRYVKGTCPKCGAKDQYGDSCEKCGISYRPVDLIGPRCAICETTPIEKEEDHIFFKLSSFSNWLENWLQEHTEESIRNKMLEWIQSGLKDWDISRDGPYFGFPIPGETNKFFYVWLDAPIGYIASSYNYFKKSDKEKLFDQFWLKNKKTELYHFIGKDIIYFHTLFWPAILETADFRTPDKVFVHGFLTINGEKMSKSRGTLVRATSYLKYLDPQALRYFYASRLSNSIDDIDLTVDEFILKYNNDVVGNFANIFSRSAKLLENLNNQLASKISEDGLSLIKHILSKKPMILDNYENRNFHKVVKTLVELGSEINKYITEKEPWNVIKTNPEKAREILTDAMNAGWLLSIYLKPILPSFCQGIENLLNVPYEYPKNFTILSEDIKKQKFLPANHRIQNYRHLAARITKEMVESMFKEELKENEIQENQKLEDKSYITIEEFQKVELKVGKILEAKEVDGSEKLLNLIVDIGEKKPRNVFAGIKKSYSAQDLIGKKIILVTNLQPRKMKFGISEAMVLATGEEGKLSLIVPEKEVEEGSIIK